MMISRIILLVFCGYIAASSAFTYPEDLENFSNDLAEFINTVHDFESFTRHQDVLKDTGCSCQDDKCGCCATIASKLLKINSTGCVNMTFDKATDIITVIMTLDGKVYVNESVDLHNPPALCQGLPYVASWCTVFSNISWTTGKVGACLHFELRLFGNTILKIPVGCFYFPTMSRVDREKRGADRRGGKQSKEFFNRLWKQYGSVVRDHLQQVRRREGRNRL